MDIRTKVAQAHQRFTAGVFDFNPRIGGFKRNEDLVFGLLAKADHRGSLQVELALRTSDADRALPLHRDPAAGTGIFDRTFRAGIQRQLLGAEQLLAVDVAIDNPLVGVASAGRFFSGL